MKPQDRIVASELGLQTLREGEPSLLMPWAEVSAVSFSKVDAITFIITYLTFDYDWGEFVEVDDSTEGFEHLVLDLSKHLRIVFPDWQDALRAASPNEAPVIIYERSDF